jgi:hypothetical protein
MAEPSRRAGDKGRRRFLRRLGASVAATLGGPALSSAQARKTQAKRPARPRTAAPARPAPKASAAAPAPPPEPAPVRVARGGWPSPDPGARVDMAPARWIWLPGERTLANSFVLFRREIDVAAAPSSARGFVSADSRYRLYVNGRRVQTGPAPCDPRSYEADPVDLARWLVPGRNVIAAEVVFYGHGEGSWPFGKPGFLFALRVEEPGGRVSEIVSDESWRVLLDRAHRPGQFRRSYQRALQEEFDARLHPWGWSSAGFVPDEAWLAPRLLDAPADRPAAADTHADYLADSSLDREGTALRAREVPLVRETLRPVDRLARSSRVRWRRDPRDWFEFGVPDAFEVVDESAATPAGEASWRVEPRPKEGVLLTFELPEPMVGFPYLTVEAPAGTVVELVAQEAPAAADAGPFADLRFSWTRLVCRAGVNRFECFEQESLRFLQLHVREAEGPVLVRDVGLRRRSYAWPSPPSFRVAEPALQGALDDSFNTLVNTAQESVVDPRTRQQTGEGAAQPLAAARAVCGDRQLARRFLRGYALGQALDGYFLGAWPAYDPLNRLAQRHVNATPEGPRLEHGLGFALDAWRHYQETGESDLPAQIHPRFVRFASYLLERRGKDGLLPVEGWGVPSVWVGDGFERQRHRQCAFNLLAAAALKHALAPLAALSGDAAAEKRFGAAADALVVACAARFWSRERSLFVCNLPWEDEEGTERLDDRSLATALLFDQCPEGRAAESVRALAQPSEGLLLSDAAGSIWRLRALARHGRIDAVLRALRERGPAAVGPLVVLYGDVAGIRPGEPGFAKAEIRPQLGDLRELELVYHTPRGPVTFRAEAQEEGHRAFVTLPADCPGELVLPLSEGRGVALTAADRALGLERFALPKGETTEFDVPAVRST